MLSRRSLLAGIGAAALAPALPAARVADYPTIIGTEFDCGIIEVSPSAWMPDQGNRIGEEFTFQSRTTINV